MPGTILDEILKKKREEIARAQKRIPEPELEQIAKQRKDIRDFVSAMSQGPEKRARIIAEIKRASPSKGMINPDLDPATLARAYQRGGAAAISVLTDKPFFMGSLEDLKAARSAVTLPVLRKDFIISEYQVYESAAAGADAILLITRILDDNLLMRLASLAAELSLGVLAEIHHKEEIERVARIPARVIGINNRNLSDFTTDVLHAASIAGSLPPDRIPVAASGIKSMEDISANLRAGIRCFLIGEYLSASDDPEKRLADLCSADA